MGSNIGLSFVRRKAFAGTNDDLLSVGSLVRMELELKYYSFP